MISTKCALAVGACVLTFMNSFPVNSEEKSASIRFYTELVPPFYWLDENEKPQGAAFDLARALIEETQVTATIEHLPWARAFHEAVNTPDVVLLTALKTKERSSQLQWLGKIHTANAYLIGLQSNHNLTITNLEQAKAYTVGTIRGYGAANYLREKGFEEGVNLKLLSQPDQLWSMLYKKRIDFVLSNLTTGSFEIIDAGWDPAQVTGVFQLKELTVNLEMATGKETASATVNRLRKGLSGLKSNGRFQAIMRKWDLQ